MIAPVEEFVLLVGAAAGISAYIGMLNDARIRYQQKHEKRIKALESRIVEN